MTIEARSHVLLVEDDRAGREVAVFNLRGAGYDVDAEENGTRAAAVFNPVRHAVVITDLRLPGLDGMGVLRAVQARAPEVPVILVTAFADLETAVAAMRLGAQDFVPKPFGREELLLRVERALERAALRADLRALRAAGGGVERAMVVASPAMSRVLEICDRVAPTAITVLVTGETGTGKELIARRLHARSRRARRPFVVVNCAAIPPALIESELFGHAVGSFTGAVRERPGRFRQAHGGTIFLDEIGELPRAVQGRLLRVLQDGVVDVLGADRAVEVDVRVVAATHRDLVELVALGQFRADLLYRLKVVDIALPPLRERLEEVEPLVRHFVAELSEGRELAVPEDVIAALRGRAWPGNVRQLHNVCERLVTLCEGDRLVAAQLPAEPAVASVPTHPSRLPEACRDWPPLPEDGLSLVDLERRVIERVLAGQHGNLNLAARYLRVPRHVLANRVAKYGIRREGAEPPSGAAARRGRAVGG
ncbi:MAG: sigma-54-dependent Fis family transcriptional regulator [Polyangiaceae bacterium]|nr:sigma-54-dependent Fis family transcriptional regulator [Polyangiaceae bacterium]